MRQFCREDIFFARHLEDTVYVAVRGAPPPVHETRDAKSTVAEQVAKRGIVPSRFNVAALRSIAEGTTQLPRQESVIEGI